MEHMCLGTSRTSAISTNAQVTQSQKDALETCVNAKADQWLVATCLTIVNSSLALSHLSAHLTSRNVMMDHLSVATRTTTASLTLAPPMVRRLPANGISAQMTSRNVTMDQLSVVTHSMTASSMLAQLTRSCSAQQT